MKRLPILLVAIVAMTVCLSCNDEDTNYWTAYKDWRESNLQYIADKEAETDASG